MPPASPSALAMPDDQDEALLDRARNGDPAAREELFRRHFGVAYRIAYRRLSHEQDALDAVQDAFVKALRHLADFDGRSGFRTWLLRIVTNAALDLGRKRKRRPTLQLETGSAEANAAVLHEDPALSLRREDLRHILERALSRLTPAIRETFILFAEAELSYKEIADIQNIPVGTVMSRLHYARQKLQSCLENEGI